MESLSWSWSDRSGACATRGKPLCHECVKSRPREVCRPAARVQSEPMDTSPASPCSRRSLVVLAATTGLGAPSAHAATGVKYGITDDAWLQSGPGTLAARLARLQRTRRARSFASRSTGIGSRRRKPAAPTDPEDAAYDWSKVDPVLDGLHARGIDGRPAAERRADAGRTAAAPANYAPTSATTFRDFATAAATRYSWVKRWLIWNEPNQVRWLRPTSAVGLHVAPAQSRLRRRSTRVISGALVAGGGTAPRGSTGGVSPVAWLTGMRAAHARLDAYAHNPYPLDPKRESPASRRLRELHDDHDGDDQQARLARLAQLPARAHLADRVRLPEQSARPAARRVAGAAGAVRRRRRLRRVPHAARRHADPLPRTATSRTSRASRAGS